MGRISNDDIEWLVALAAREGLVEIEVTDGECSTLVRCAAPAGAPAPDVVAAALLAEPEPPLGQRTTAVRAPMGGVFYRSPAPDSPSFVEVGDDVQNGETVALIEAMKLYNDITAPCSGRVESILVSDGDHVDADQELMLIRPIGE